MPIGFVHTWWYHLNSVGSKLYYHSKSIQMVLENPLIHHLEVSKQGFVLAVLSFGKIQTRFCISCTTIQNHLGNQCCNTVISPFKTTIANGFKWCINLYEKGTKSRTVNVVQVSYLYEKGNTCNSFQFLNLYVCHHSEITKFMNRTGAAYLFGACQCVPTVCPPWMGVLCWGSRSSPARKGHGRGCGRLATETPSRLNSLIAHSTHATTWHSVHCVGSVGEFGIEAV